jgi:hypothetical protein
MQHIFKWPAVFVFALLVGCSQIKLVADYDERIDNETTSLHKKTEEFLIRLESTAGTSEGAYENHKTFYEECKVVISSLRVRADAIQRNSLTVRMFDKLLKNIERLEADHKEGIAAEEIPLYRGGLNSQFTAILTFELAKKRGEKPDEQKAGEPSTKITGE